MGTINTKFLHYQKLPRSFFAEISDLPGNRIPLEPIYDHTNGVPNGVGFELVSQNTGDVIPMQAVRTKFDATGEEIVAYIFEPVDKAETRIKQVVLLND